MITSIELYFVAKENTIRICTQMYTHSIWIDNLLLDPIIYCQLQLSWFLVQVTYSKYSKKKKFILSPLAIQWSHYALPLKTSHTFNKEIKNNKEIKHSQQYIHSYHQMIMKY